MSASAALMRLRDGDAAAALAMLDATDTADAPTLEARGMSLLALGRAAEARAALAAAIAAGGAGPALLLNRALAEDLAGDSATARHWMAEIAAHYPDWSEPHLRLAESHRRTGDAGAAASAYVAALDRDPTRAECLLGLASLRLAAGAAAEAQTLLLRCVGLHPGLRDGWHLLGLALLQQNDALAEAAFAEAHRLAPDDFAPALERVRAAHRFGFGAREMARLELASAAAPADAVLLTARGLMASLLGQRDAAIDLLEAACGIRPDAAEPAVLLAGLLARTPRVTEAERALRRARALRPEDVQLTNDLAAVLMRRQCHGEAAALLRAACARHGAHPVLLSNLANATVSLGLQDEAARIAREAIALAPEEVLPRRALANVLPYVATTTAEELFSALRETGARFPRAGLAPRNVPDPSRRLRLGLLSGGFRVHPVGWLTIAGFEALDPAAFEIHCLAQATFDDAIARRFRAIAAGWHRIETLDDAALATLCRELEIDVLIDLGGYGDAGRLPACARRLAPVQVKWVGMQTHSTGLPDIDWFITDRWETPPAHRHLYSERLLYLADGYVCYSPPAYAPSVGPLPALANGHVTFGCFNNLAKITPVVLDTWAELLHRLSGARLVLKTHQMADEEVRARITAAFTSRGIAAARIDLRGGSPHRDLLSQYRDIDIVLDPFPYTGGLTTCEALWMGVPTVTIAGGFFAARHAYSHLANVGLADWAATDREGYLSIAEARAADLAALAELRAGLRERVRSSPLCDAPRFGRNLGAALRHAWCAWCAEQETHRELTVAQ
jgi:predicted O-linked N-acetylglucosamine transferase (SPINDLY family)